MDIFVFGFFFFLRGRGGAEFNPPSPLKNSFHVKHFLKKFWHFWTPSPLEFSMILLGVGVCWSFNSFSNYTFTTHSFLQKVNFVVKMISIIITSTLIFFFCMWEHKHWHWQQWQQFYLHPTFTFLVLPITTRKVKYSSQRQATIVFLIPNHTLY